MKTFLNIFSYVGTFIIGTVTGLGLVGGLLAIIYSKEGSDGLYEWVDKIAHEGNDEKNERSKI